MAVAFLLASTAHSGNLLRTVAVTGQQAPGLPDGSLFSTSSPESCDCAPKLNDSGQVSFIALASSEGIWSERSGSLMLVAQNGEQAPGTTSGMTFNGFSQHAMDKDGSVSFQAQFGSNSIDYGVWSEHLGTPQLLARVGAPAPGTGVFSNFSGVYLNNTGQALIRANISGSGINSTNNEGLWSGDSEGMNLVAREGNPAVGLPTGVDYGSFMTASPSINNLGQTAFHATLSGIGVDSTNDRAIWSEGSGTLALVARMSDPAAGTPSGVHFSTLSSVPRLNDSGKIAFTASLAGSGVNSTNDQGLWSDRAGSLALILREGQQAPGTPNGTNFANSFGFFDWNDAGQFSFVARLSGTGVDALNNEGLWTERSGNFELLARTGDQAPGTPNGVSFSSFIHPIFMNNAGQVVFRANLTGSGVDSTNREGIWATDRSGTATLVAREGDLLEVLPGDFRTITGLGSINNFDDGGLNDFGQIAFRAQLGNSWGIFVSSVVSVPEPSATFILLPALMGFLAQRRRWRLRRVHSEVQNSSTGAIGCGIGENDI